MAGRQVLLTDADGRTEGAARDRPRLVELAKPGDRVQYGARQRRMLFQEAVQRFRFVGKHTGCRIPGELRTHYCDGLLGAVPHGLSPPRISSLQLIESSTQSPCIQGRDRERTDATFDATGAANKVIAGPPRRLLERLVQAGQQFAILLLPGHWFRVFQPNKRPSIPTGN